MAKCIHSWVNFGDVFFDGFHWAGQKSEIRCPKNWLVAKIPDLLTVFVCDYKTTKEQGAPIIVHSEQHPLPHYHLKKPPWHQYIHPPVICPLCLHILIWASWNSSWAFGHPPCSPTSSVTVLIAGFPPKIITASGGWTSVTFLLYWCCIEEDLQTL